MLCNFLNSLLLDKSDIYRAEDVEMIFLNETYLPYERCLVNLKKIDGNYSYSTQNACTSSGGVEYPPLILPGQSTKSGLYGLFGACQLGFGHAGQGGLAARETALAPDGDSCHVRTISQRTGLRSVWRSSAHPKIHRGALDDLFQFLKTNNVKHIAFVGDSITMQLSKFFGCDISRTPGVSIAGNTFLLQHSNKLEQSASFEGWGHTLHVSTSKTKVACTYDLTRAEGCDTLENKRVSVYNLMKGALLHAGRTGTTTSPTIVVYNAGLHVFSSNRDWIIAPMVRALLTAARESRGQFYIVFRETSTQHFLSRRGGCYDGELSKSYRGGSDFCCGKLDETEAIAGDWRNRMYQEEFRRQDPHWERHVGWLPFFNTTL
eukprot:gene12450-26193_t